MRGKGGGGEESVYYLNTLPISFVILSKHTHRSSEMKYGYLQHVRVIGSYATYAYTYCSLRVSEAKDVSISSHIWVAWTTFKQP